MEVITGDDCFRKLDLKEHVFYYFAAGWCKPCQESSPLVEEMVKEYSTNKIKFFKVDMDTEENNEFIQKCSVQSIPSFIIFKDREYIDRVIGGDIKSIKDMIDYRVFGKGINKSIHNVVVPNNPPPPPPPEPEIKDFYPNDTFQGEYEGFVFKNGDKGMGYYIDNSKKTGSDSSGGSGIEVHMVYGSWCGHSRNALPAFEELVKVNDIQTSVGTPIKFVLTEDKSDGMKRFREGEPKVRGFPTYMIVKSDDTMEVLQGHDRSKDSIIKAVKELKY